MEEYLKTCFRSILIRFYLLLFLDLVIIISVLEFFSASVSRHISLVFSDLIQVFLIFAICFVLINFMFLVIYFILIPILIMFALNPNFSLFINSAMSS